MPLHFLMSDLFDCHSPGEHLRQSRPARLGRIMCKWDQETTPWAEGGLRTVTHVASQRFCETENPPTLNIFVNAPFPASERPRRNTRK